MFFVRKELLFSLRLIISLIMLLCLKIKDNAKKYKSNIFYSKYNMLKLKLFIACNNEKIKKRVYFNYFLIIKIMGDCYDKV